jgi:catechol 2,3-dioxygenase-like lactoylglutathione lyase family enzyme
MSQPDPLFRAIDCVSLRVDDLNAALDFYSRTLGHELIWRTDDAAGLRLQASEAELVLHTDERPMETEIEVCSVPEAINRFVKAGGELVAMRESLHQRRETSIERGNKSDDEAKDRNT